MSELTKEEQEAMESLPEPQVEMDEATTIEEVRSELMQGEVCGWCGDPLSGEITWEDEIPMHQACREKSEVMEKAA